jgi:HEAT repeat protein
MRYCNVMCIAGLLLAAQNVAPAAPKEAAPADVLSKVGVNTMYEGPGWNVGTKLVEETLAGGAPAVLAVVDSLPVPGEKPDFKPRYILSALTAYVSAPGREAQRRMYVDALASALGKDYPKEVRKQVILHLRWVGDAKAAPALGKCLLAEQDIHEVACLALGQIGGEVAAEQLRQALPKAKEPLVRAAILGALGEARDGKSLSTLSAALTDANREVRLAAAYALAKLGLAESAAPLLKAADAKSVLERGEMHAACFALAKRLAADGKAEDAARIGVEIFKTRPETSLKTAAVGLLAACPGAAAAEAVAGALKSDDARLRETAIVAVASSAPIDSLKAALDLLAADTVRDGRPLLLRVLGQRRDLKAMPLVLAAMKDASPAVREAAAHAAADLGAPEAVPVMIDMLKAGPSQGKSTSSARVALERIVGEQVAPQVAAAAAKAEGPRKADLLAVLAARGARAQVEVVAAAMADKDNAVRSAAVRALGVLGDAKHAPLVLDFLAATNDEGQGLPAETAVAAIGLRFGNAEETVALVLKRMESHPAVKESLVRILGQIASPAGLPALRAALKDADAKVQDAVFRAFTAWPDDAVAEDLIALARSAPGDAQRTLTLRAFERVAKKSSRPMEERLKLALAGMAAAKTDDERKLLLSVMQSIPSTAALEQVLPYLKRPELVEEAGAAAVGIALSLRVADAAVVRPALEQVQAVCKNPRTLDEARRCLQSLKRK